MERYCFIHAADLHLDTPFEGFRKTAPEVHERLLDASLDAWDALVEGLPPADALLAEVPLRAQIAMLTGKLAEAAGYPTAAAQPRSCSSCIKGLTKYSQWAFSATSRSPGNSAPVA